MTLYNCDGGTLAEPADLAVDLPGGDLEGDGLAVDRDARILSAVKDDWVAHILANTPRLSGYPFQTTALAPLMGCPDLLAHVLRDPRVYLRAGGVARLGVASFTCQPELSPADEEWARGNAEQWWERILAAPDVVKVATIHSALSAGMEGRPEAVMTRLNALINVIRLYPSLHFGVDSRMWLTVRAAGVEPMTPVDSLPLPVPVSPVPVTGTFAPTSSPPTDLAAPLPLAAPAVTVSTAYSATTAPAPLPVSDPVHFDSPPQAALAGEMG